MGRERGSEDSDRCSQRKHLAFRGVSNEGHLPSVDLLVAWRYLEQHAQLWRMSGVDALVDVTAELNAPTDDDMVRLHLHQSPHHGSVSLFRSGLAIMSFHCDEAKAPIDDELFGLDRHAVVISCRGVLDRLNELVLQEHCHLRAPVS